MYVNCKFSIFYVDNLIKGLMTGGPRIGLGNRPLTGGGLTGSSGMELRKRPQPQSLNSSLALPNKSEQQVWITFLIAK